ncbi:hypothetical protein KSS87_012918, partial [Heliosperma pusillum]
MFLSTPMTGLQSLRELLRGRLVGVRLKGTPQAGYCKCFFNF